MRKFLWLALAASGISFTSGAQDSMVIIKPDTVAVVKKTDWKKVNLGSRANDHFMIQFGYDAWAGKPDTINITGFSRHFNFYLMYDMPFKTAPRMSVAAGLGVGSSSIFFDKTNIDIAGKINPTRISFINAENTNHFKKYKTANTWLEVPVELRFVSNPLHSGNSFKVALGMKVGTMIDAHTKGKNLESSTGLSLNGSKYIAKEKSRKFYTNARLAPTIRIGFGPATVYGSYSITKMFKDGQGPDVHLWSVGLCVSGL